MSDTPTAALVEEAETHTTCDKCGAAIVKYSDFTGLLPTEDGMRSHTPLVCERTQELRRAEAELDAATTQLAKKFKRIEELERRCTQAESERDELRATVTRLNRRAQTAEAGVRDNVEACKAAGVSMGRTLANAAADMYLRRAEQAEAERDAQHALVLRLTAERDEEKSNALQMLADSGRRAIASARLAADLDEFRAQVWGLICAGSNMAERRRYFQGLWETLLADGLKRDAQLSELTATRDLLLTENAQLQQMLSRPDPVVHETPVDGVVPCCGQKLHDLKDGSRVNEGPLVNCDRMRLLTRVSELSSANLVLTAENARLQERVATLELLLRGGR